MLKRHSGYLHKQAKSMRAALHDTVPGRPIMMTTIGGRCVWGGAVSRSTGYRAGRRKARYNRWDWVSGREGFGCSHSFVTLYLTGVWWVFDTYIWLRHQEFTFRSRKVKQKRAKLELEPTRWREKTRGKPLRMSRTIL